MNQISPSTIVGVRFQKLERFITLMPQRLTLSTLGM